EVCDAIALHDLVCGLADGPDVCKAFSPSSSLIQGFYLGLCCGHTSSEGCLGCLRLPQRTHYQTPLHPTPPLPFDLQAHGSLPLPALGDQCGLAFWVGPHNRDKSLLAAPNRLECLKVARKLRRSPCEPHQTWFSRHQAAARACRSSSL